MQLLRSDQLVLPGNCVSCGTCSPDRTYIDFGITVEFFGTIYYCSECFPSVAEIMGYISRTTVNDFEHMTRMWEKSLFESSVKIEALKNVVAVLCTDPDSLLDSIDRIVGDAVSRMEAANRVSSSDEGTSVSDSVSDESFGLEGFDDLLAATAVVESHSKRKSTRSNG